MGLYNNNVWMYVELNKELNIIEEVVYYVVYYFEVV